MPTSTTIPTSAFPQVADNRTLGEAKLELAQYSGGGARDDILSRAGTSYLRAVREFNDIKWKFNRMVDDITLVADEPDYDLENDFKSPMRAIMVDSDSKTRDTVMWVPHEEWIYHLPDQSTTGSMPIYYTVRNAHQTGIVTVDPIPATELTWPIMRIHYHRRIVLPVADIEKVNAPVEVEEAIFSRAVALFLAMVRNHREAGEANVEAAIRRSRVEIEHRDWEDF